MNIYYYSILFFLYSSTITAQKYSFQQTIAPNDRKSDDWFSGNNALDVQNGIMLAGSFFHDYDLSQGTYKPEAGAAYFIKIDDTNATFLQKIVASDRQMNDRFGFSVKIGTELAFMGSIWNDLDSNSSNYLSNAGAVYVFKKNLSNSYFQIQKVVAYDRKADDEFGCSIDFLNDKLIIGSQFHGFNAQNNFKKQSGAAYIYQSNASGKFQSIGKLTAYDRDTNDNFGNAVCFISDSLISVAANAHDLDSSSANWLQDAGAVYLFKLNQNGIWGIHQKLTAPDRNAFDGFGDRIMSNGKFLVVSAKRQDFDSSGQNYVSNSGAVYIYKLDQNKLWQFNQKLTAQNRNTSMSFGSSINLSDSILLVGAEGDNLDSINVNSISRAGSVFIFRLGNGNYWYLIQKISLPNRNVSDFFGSSVCIWDNKVLVGARNDEVDSNINSGTVSIFSTPKSVQNSIDKVENDYNINLFPNPSLGFLTIEADLIITGIRIIDVSGKEIFSKNDIKSNHVSINVNIPNPGLHFIEMLDINGIIHFKKILFF